MAGSRATAVWLATIARPVAARALPTWLGVAILAGVVMGGNGLAPADAVALATSSPRALAVLGGAWLLLSSAAVRLAVDAPGAAYLRALPGGPARERLAIVVVAAAVHLPWAGLWLAGAGAGPAAGAWLGMTAASLAPALAAAAALGRRATVAPRWRGPVRALAGVHARDVVRRRSSALVAGAGVAALAGAFAGLMIGHEARDARDAVILAGAVAPLGLAVALAAATVAVADSAQRLRWLTAAAALPGAPPRLAQAVVFGGLGLAAAGVATLAAVAVAPLAGATVAAVAATHALVGLGTGLAAVEVGARAAGGAEAAARVDGGRVVVGLVLVGVVGLVLVGLFRAPGVAVFALVGVGLVAGGGRRA